MKKLAVITGGTQGIGKALIESLAAEGFSIATCARTEEALLQLKKAITTTYPDIDFFTRVVDASKKKKYSSLATGCWNKNCP